MDLFVHQAWKLILDALKEKNNFYQNFLSLKFLKGSALYNY